MWVMYHGRLISPGMVFDIFRYSPLRIVRDFATKRPVGQAAHLTRLILVSIPADRM
jgi:hypothetical protein